MKRSLAGDRNHNYLLPICGSKMGSTALCKGFLQLRPEVRLSSESTRSFTDGPWTCRANISPLGLRSSKRHQVWDGSCSLNLSSPN